MTIREAKARLNALVEAAERGEQVVLMRGSTLVAAIVPLSAADLELPPRLTDPQAERLWRRLHEERRDGSSILLESPQDAVTLLSGKKTARARGASTLPRTRARRR